MRKSILAPLLTSTLVFGCGGAGESQFGNVASNSEFIPPTNQIIGRAYLQEPIVGAPVTFRDVRGNVIGSTATADFGEFAGPIDLPSDFLVQVNLPDGQTIGAEIVNFAGPNDSIVVNLPTSLALLYHQRHPELTYAEASAQIVKFLAASPDCTPESLDNSRHGFFQAQELLRRAQANGGLNLYLLELVRRAESGQVVSFASVFETLDDLITECAIDAAKDGLTAAGLAGAEAYAGWICEALGFNNPFPTMRSISTQLEGISEQITNLQSSIARGNAQNNYNRLVSHLGTDVVGPIDHNVGVLRQTISDASAHPTTAPIPVNTFSSVTEDIVNAFNVFTAQVALQELADNLIGTPTVGGPSQRLERLLIAVDNPPLGLKSDLSRFFGYQAYTNTVLTMRHSVLDYYLNYFQEGAMVDSEQLHLTQSSGTLVTNIRQGQADFIQWAKDVKMVRLQLPDPLPSDQVFLDREKGLMWYMGKSSSFKQKEHSDAQDVAKHFKGTGPYTKGWRLPKKSELFDLYDNLIEPGAQAESVKNDKRANVLTRLGWDITYMKDNHHVWADDENAQVSLDTGSHVNYQPFYTHNDIVLVRSYPGSNDDSVLGLGQADPASFRLDASNPTGLRALATVHPANGSGKKGKDSETDITTKVVWSSSNDSMASISNFPGSEGKVVWHAQLGGRALTPVTMSYQYYTSQGGTNYQVTEAAKITLPPPVPAPVPTLSSIRPFPYNVSFGLPTAANPIQQRFSAVLFYLDPNTGDTQVQDYLESAAPKITWSLTDRDNHPLQSSENSGFTDGNLLVLSSTLRTADLNVHAQVGNLETIVPIHCAIQP